MEANPPVPQPTSRRQKVYRARWAIWGAALGIGVAIGAMVALSHKHSNASADDSAVSTWPAGARPAPAFTLTDEHGKSFSLASLHGRSAIVTFIDPLCRDFCPREASILTEAAAKLGAKAPAIVSVSVDPWADTATNFKADAAHWKLGPTWRWGTGTYAELARVWKPYDVGVEVTQQDDRRRQGALHHPHRRRLPDRREGGRARALPLPVHDRPGRVRRAGT